MEANHKKVNKEFRLSSWAIDNKNTAYVMMIVILFLGVSAYYSMPRENFPEVKSQDVCVGLVAAEAVLLRDSGHHVTADSRR